MEQTGTLAASARCGTEKAVLIVDDHPLYRIGMLATLAPLRLRCAEAPSLMAALDALARPRFDLILYDWHLPDGGGCRGLVAICQLASDVPVVVVSADEDEAIRMAAMSIGALGFLSKATDPACMREAVRGYLFGSAGADTEEVAPADPAHLPRRALTQRQREVLQLMARGDPNKRIADQLGIAETTVRAHVSDILQLMQVRNRTEAVVWASRHRLDMSFR